MPKQRRKRLLETMGPNSLAIVLGAKLATRSNDTEYRFRQDSDFHYLTDFDHPNAAALLRTNGEPEFTLFVEPRVRAQEIWTGFRPGVKGAVHEYAADEALPISDLSEQLPEVLKGVERVYHVLGRDAAVDQKLVDTIENMRRSSRKGVTPPTQIVDLRSLVHEMRLFKEQGELALLREAATITAEAHHEAARLAYADHYEYELEAVIEYTFRRKGAAGPAYNTIVGGGANATVLHYIENSAPLQDGQLVLIDAGCEWKGYASDVTRTYPIGGCYKGAERDVYSAVLEAQRSGLEASKPGASLKSIHETVLRKLVEGMISLGLLQGGPEELIESKAYEPYYMHGTSHWLGLDVHDVGNYTIGGEPRKLEPGMVFTMEPGLYIATDDENAPESLRGIGVRIEDDVLITSAGHENLTAAIPKEIEAVEAWMKEN